jgi:DNA-binding NarL/FixJ family response regulator
MQALPDVILLDAMMPGMDGFEVARRLKTNFATRHIPVIFMTGLTETEHVVAGFEAGGADYVTKPIHPREVLARIAVHTRNARQMRQARSALDACGLATLAIRPQGRRLVWQTVLARELLRSHFTAPEDVVPDELRDWLDGLDIALRVNSEILPLNIQHSDRRLIFSFQEKTPDGEWLIVLREESDAAAIEGLTLAFRLTKKEAEVLYWVVRGKTNRDIGDILGSSPRTVNKHLEHVFAKLGVETRTAAAALAMDKVRAVGAAA